MLENMHLKAVLENGILTSLIRKDSGKYVIDKIEP